MTDIGHGIGAGMGVGTNLDMKAGLAASVTARAHFLAECFDKDGNLKWVEEADNIVVNEGLDDILDKFFKGSTYTEDFSVGLIDQTSAGALVAADTGAQIGGTNAWAELTNYTEGVREDLVLGVVASQSVDNSASKASFSINATVTIEGAFIVNGDNAKNGVAGIIYGEAAFAAERGAINGDTLNVTVTLTAASA